jgi:hypothetical protein
MGRSANKNDKKDHTVYLPYMHAINDYIFRLLNKRKAFMQSRIHVTKEASHFNPQRIGSSRPKDPCL